MRHRKVLTSAMVIGIAGSAMPAWAQNAEAGDAAQAGSAVQAVVSDIVVTARKKSAAERVQDVPIAVSAVSGAQIEATHAVTLTDVGMSMPNVRLDDGGAFPGVSNFTVRGMGFNSTIASVEPTVGLFVDGIYIGANLGGLGDTYDLESVEVLRGPQGTLFGRNVTGGAVVMNSRLPTGQFGGDFRVGGGSGGRVLVAGDVQGSLTDTLAGKVYAQFDHMSGDFHNQATGGTHGRDQDIFVRPSLRWRPTSAIDITLIGEYGKTDGDGVNTRIVDDPTQLVYKLGGRAPVGGADQLNINYDGYTHVEWGQVVLNANWTVGPGTVTSITGYRTVDYGSAGDTDGSQLEVARAINLMNQHQFSEELRYAGKALGDRLDFTVGAYYFEQELSQKYHVIFFGASNQRSGGELHHQAASVFAQGDLQFVPNVFLTLGGRYSWETKSAWNAATPACDLSLNCTLTYTGQHSWDNFTPKVGLNWKATSDVMLYASWTKGFRSGGYNIRTTGTNESPGPYDQETVSAFEVGAKTEFLDHRAKLNIAAFHNKYTGLQRTVNVGLINYIANVAAATTKGVEFEASLLPLPNLALTGSLGYLDARYDSYPSLFPNNPSAAIGLVLVRAPKWTYAIAATHDLSVGSAGTLTSRVSLTYNAKTAANDANNYFVPSWHLLDASMAWSPSQYKGLKVSLWAKNLTNETYAVTGTYVAGLFTDLYQALPRRYGIEFSYKF
jgi:iron complex outermembrane receptor protein